MTVITLNLGESPEKGWTLCSVSLWMCSKNSWCVSCPCLCADVVSHGSNLDKSALSSALGFTLTALRLWEVLYIGITILQLVPFRPAFWSHRPDLQRYFDVMNTQENKAVHFALMVCQNQTHENLEEMCHALIFKALYVFFSFFQALKEVFSLFCGSCRD